MRLGVTKQTVHRKHGTRFRGRWWMSRIWRLAWWASARAWCLPSRRLWTCQRRSCGRGPLAAGQLNPPAEDDLEHVFFHDTRPGPGY